MIPPPSLCVDNAYRVRLSINFHKSIAICAHVRLHACDACEINVCRGKRFREAP